MKRLLVLFVLLVLFDSCKDIDKMRLNAVVANVDSLFAKMQLQSDFEEIKLREWTVERITPIWIITRSAKAQWVADKRVAKGKPGNFDTFLSDSSFNPISRVMFTSKKLNAVVVDQAIWQVPDLTYSRLFGASEWPTTGYVFKAPDYTEFVAEQQVGHYEWMKSHGTNYFVSSLTGSDVDDGLSWANAKLTLGSLNGSWVAGDTTAMNGSFTEAIAFADDGSSGDPIVIMDSLSFTAGGSQLDLSDPDTSKAWSATITIGAVANGLNFSTDNYFDVINLRVAGATSALIRINNCTDVRFLQNRIYDHGDGSGQLINITGTSAGTVVAGNVFSDDGVNRAINHNATGTLTSIINNTFHGVYTSQVIYFDSPTGTTDFVNNILENASGTSSDLCVQVDAPTSTYINDWDNNIFYGASLTNEFSFNGNTFSSITVWEDSVNGYDADGAANSLESDPLLQAKSTTKYITTSSPADQAAAAGTYNSGDIGWYQVAAVGGAPPAQMIFIKL